MIRKLAILSPMDVYAVEQVDAPGFGQTHDFIDGRGGFFHPGCPPERLRWERRERPAS
jgi:hypothetical protein